MGARGYAAGLGRFMTEDPVLQIPGFGQTMDRYEYAIQNPLTVYDLAGRSPEMDPPWCTVAVRPQCEQGNGPVSHNWLVRHGAIPKPEEMRPTQAPVACGLGDEILGRIVGNDCAASLLPPINCGTVADAYGSVSGYGTIASAATYAGVASTQPEVAVPVVVALGATAHLASEAFQTASESGFC
jgi:hypothetical protein